MGPRKCQQGALEPSPASSILMHFRQSIANLDFYRWYFFNLALTFFNLPASTPQTGFDVINFFLEIFGESSVDKSILQEQLVILYAGTLRIKCNNHFLLTQKWWMCWIVKKKGQTIEWRKRLNMKKKSFMTVIWFIGLVIIFSILSCQSLTKPVTCRADHDGRTAVYVDGQCEKIP